MRSILLFLITFFAINSIALFSQSHSVSREWNETLLFSIKNDFARPTVHARNLFHFSAAMYDAWAIFDETAKTVFIGQTVGGFNIPYQTTSYIDSKEIALHKAISYASYRILKERFKKSNKVSLLYETYANKMAVYGYDTSFISSDYTNGDARALGNYIGNKILEFGFQDFSNETNTYKNLYYKPNNEEMVVKNSGNKNINDLNRWQPLALDVIIDQSGNIIGSGAAPFLGAEWGKVIPFSLSQDDLEILQRDSQDWWVYHKPAPPPYISFNSDIKGLEDFYKWNFALVSTWSAHHTPEDTTVWEISPKGLGNIKSYPKTEEEYKTFYNIIEGGDSGRGYDINPKTGLPYESQLRKRGDYTRVLSEFWADGPNSTTPPGHWFEILNYVKDQTQFTTKYNSSSYEMDPLEYDVKTYLLLGGTMHDVAVATWGIKGYYDYVRPITALRGMAELGQSTDPTNLNYHPGGLPLIPEYIEIIQPSDPLRGKDGENIGEIKIKAWKGPNYIVDIKTDVAYVDWILAKDWWPYQRATFVTPPFAGYMSGHSTYSSAAAEILTFVTGDEYFPGGMGEFHAPKETYLIHEFGPTEDIKLQWARYKDASDQCSLSRIWGGIHPPCDDIPGREIGTEIAKDAIAYVSRYFYADEDNDGHFADKDCNDTNSNIHPSAQEICNGLDENCNREIDENINVYTYYLDLDNDGFGDLFHKIDTCITSAPQGYAIVGGDCNTANSTINPNGLEICNGIDDNCDNSIDEGLTLYPYFADADNDGYGYTDIKIESCYNSAPQGFTNEKGDCNDSDFAINPTALEICDDIDNNCNGSTDEGLILFTYYEDTDGDSTGNAEEILETCKSIPPIGFVVNNIDCDDTNNLISPFATEIPDNGVDENCDGKDLITTSVISYDYIANHLFKNYIGNGLASINFWNVGGQLIFTQQLDNNKTILFDLKNYPTGIYIVELIESGNESKKFRKLIMKY